MLRNPTPTDPLDNNLADQVHNGDKTGVSLVDAWKQMARAKGIRLPEDGGQVPNIDQTRNTKDQKPNTAGMEMLAAILAWGFYTHSRSPMTRKQICSLV